MNEEFDDEETLPPEPKVDNGMASVGVAMFAAIVAHAPPFYVLQHLMDGWDNAIRCHERLGDETFRYIKEEQLNEYRQALDVLQTAILLKGKK